MTHAFLRQDACVCVQCDTVDPDVLRQRRDRLQKEFEAYKIKVSDNKHPPAPINKRFTLPPIVSSAVRRLGVSPGCGSVEHPLPHPVTPVARPIAHTPRANHAARAPHSHGSTAGAHCTAGGARGAPPVFVRRERECRWRPGGWGRRGGQERGWWWKW